MNEISPNFSTIFAWTKKKIVNRESKNLSLKNCFKAFFSQLYGSISKFKEFFVNFKIKLKTVLKPFWKSMKVSPVRDANWCFFAIWKLINEMRCETKRKKLYRRHKIKISISEKLFIGIKKLKIKRMKSHFINEMRNLKKFQLIDVLMWNIERQTNFISDRELLSPMFDTQSRPFL